VFGIDIHAGNEPNIHHREVEGTPALSGLSLSLPFPLDQYQGLIYSTRSSRNLDSTFSTWPR
jgi:hypothetical protein